MPPMETGKKQTDREQRDQNKRTPAKKGYGCCPGSCCAPSSQTLPRLSIRSAAVRAAGIGMRCGLFRGALSADMSAVKRVAAAVAGVNRDYKNQLLRADCKTGVKQNSCRCAAPAQTAPLTCPFHPAFRRQRRDALCSDYLATKQC